MIETDEHQIFRKTLRDLFEREIEPHIEAWEAARTFPAHELFPKLAAVGLLGLEYDEAYGAGFEDMQRRVPDISKAGYWFGYAPTQSLDDIIKSVVAYYNSSMAQPTPQVSAAAD